MNTTLGHRLAVRRTQQDLAQGDLASRAGITQTHLSEIEHNRRPLDRMAAGTLVKVARALEVSTDYLLGLTDDPTPHWTRQEGVS
jgi:transcriptional regulator with XRE-family HTH domain